MRTYIRIVHQELFFYGTRIGCGVSNLVALCGINRVELPGSCYTDKQGI